METKYMTFVIHHDEANVYRPKKAKKSKKAQKDKGAKVFWAMMYVLMVAAIIFAAVTTVYALGGF